MNVCGQSKAFGFHGVLKPTFKVLQQIICLFFGDETFFQKVGGTGAINVSLLYSCQIHLNSFVNGASKSLMAF